MIYTNDIIIIRGGGDLATGVIQKFHRSGFKVLVLETDKPTAIRRTVALCEAVYTGNIKVEDISCVRIESLQEMCACHERRIVPLLVDPHCESLRQIKPAAVLDITLAKRNFGTCREMAPVTIGFGPGFCAGKDVHAVIETMRGHNLGRLILEGEALPNTGIPGDICGKTAQRVIHAPIAGTITHRHKIGDVVQEGDILFKTGDVESAAPFTGLLRGLIREGLHVPKGMKVADIDPRLDVDCYTISDKARCLGGSGLEAYLYFKNKENRMYDGAGYFRLCPKSSGNGQKGGTGHNNCDYRQLSGQPRPDYGSTG